MSTFAVLGMTRDVALAEAKKRTKGTRKNLTAPGGVEPIPLLSGLNWLKRKLSRLWEGGRFDSFHRYLMLRSTPSSSLSWLAILFNAEIYESEQSVS